MPSLVPGPWTAPPVAYLGAVDLGEFRARLVGLGGQGPPARLVPPARSSIMGSGAGLCRAADEGALSLTVVLGDLESAVTRANRVMPRHDEGG
jgi:hypothetical protein